MKNIKSIFCSNPPTLTKPAADVDMQESTVTEAKKTKYYPV